MKVSDVMNEIKSRLSWFVPNEKVLSILNCDLKDVNFTLFKLSNNIEKICEVYKSFIEFNKMEQVNCCNNLNRVITDAGMVLEALGYYWINKTSLSVNLKPIVNYSKVLCKNSVDLDGQICDKWFFDIKTLSPYGDSIQSVLNKISKNYEGYVFMLTGRTDLSLDELMNKKVVKQAEEIYKSNKNGVLKLPNGGIVSMNKKEKCLISESFHNCFIWCENNYKIFLKHCHQFTTDMPYVLIEMYDKNSFPNDCKISTYMLFRTLTRRTFLQLSLCKEAAVDYDNKVIDNNLTVADAISFLSAIMFIDFNSGESFVFQNPKAKNKIHFNDFEPYMWDLKLLYDDFQGDIY